MNDAAKYLSELPTKNDEEAKVQDICNRLNAHDAPETFVMYVDDATEDRPYPLYGIGFMRKDDRGFNTSYAPIHFFRTADECVSSLLAGSI